MIGSEGYNDVDLIECMTGGPEYQVTSYDAEHAVTNSPAVKCPGTEEVTARCPTRAI